MAADGSVVFSVEADDKEAQKKLNQLRRDIERTAKAIETTGAKKDGITQQLQNARAEAQKTADAIENVKASLAESQRKLSGESIARRSGMAYMPIEEYEVTKTSVAEQVRQRDALTAQYQKQQAEIQKLEVQEQKVLTTLEQQTAQLEQQRGEAGAVERALASQSVSVMPQLAAATEQVSHSMKRGLRNILKWGFGIRSAFILIRRLRSALKEGITSFAKYDAETQASINGLKSSLNTLKVSWGAAFAPILNAVAPVLKQLISLLTAAANAVQAFFAVLRGGGSYKKVINKNNDLAESYGGAGGAAEEAERQILGFDEINKLTENSGGGGGGGADDAIETVEELVDAVEQSFLVRLALSVRDVLLTWDNLNPEQIAKKIITAITAILGASLGIAFGFGPGGILLMTLAGVVIGLVISAVTFNNDGRIGKSEILSMVTYAINGLLGGVLGFVMGGGIKGALIGASIGVGLTLLVKDVLMKNEAVRKVLTPTLLSIINGVVGAGILFRLGGGIPGAILGAVLGVGITLLIQSMKMQAAATDAFYASELGKQVQELKDKVKNVLEVDEDLKIRINSITGEVDDETLVNLGAAQALIDEIFNLDAKENKTSAEAELLKQKIEALNALGLPGIQLAFDETTQRVTSTRTEVQGLLDDLMKQYQIEAMKEAYVEAYKAQYEATQNVSNATQAAETAAASYQTALNDLAVAQAAYSAAQEEANKYASEFQSLGSGAALSEAAASAQDELAKTQAKLQEAKIAVEETKKAAEEAEQALASSLNTYDTAKEKIDTIAESLAGLAEEAKTAGDETIAGYAEGVDAAVPTAEESMKSAADSALNALRTALDEHSPSGETMKDGQNTMEGFALGVESNQSRIVGAMTTAMNAAKKVVDQAVSQMISIWRSDWGRPRIHLPIFSLYGAFNFATGSAPQIAIRDWVWMARGGIVDGATPFIAGESGKEAVVPLERNTEWIGMVANGLIDSLTSSNKLADYISGLELPSVLKGQIVPPRALNGSGSVFSDDDIDRLVSGISAALTQGESGGFTNKIYLDGREIAEVVSKHQRRMERGFA